MSVYLRATTTTPGSPRPGGSPPAATSPWLRAVRWRLHNPTLRTLAIVDIALLPPGNAFWSPDVRRIAVVALEDGLCGYATVQRLPRAARGELERAIAAVCGVAEVRFVPDAVARRRAADALTVIGQGCTVLGIFALLQLSPLIAALVLLVGIATVQIGERYAK